MNALINNKTTIGKTGKVTIWVAASYILVAVLTSIIGRPDLFDPIVVAVANIILVLGKNILDPKIKNI
jgi:hypothetical protein